MIENAVYTELVDDLRKLAALGNVLNNSNDKNISFDEIDIEAFHFDKEKNKLFLGFKAPLIDGKSMPVTLENPVGIFERDEQPKFAEDIILLDLNGGGIRSLDYDPHMGGYIMVNEIDRKDGKKKSQLWFWKGKSDQKPQPIDLLEMMNLKNVESIAPVIVNGEARLLLLSDDGKFKKKKAAHYILLEYDQLSGD